MFIVSVCHVDLSKKEIKFKCRDEAAEKAKEIYYGDKNCHSIAVYEKETGMLCYADCRDWDEVEE
jgi:hypothetical protein